MVQYDYGRFSKPDHNASDGIHAAWYMGWFYKFKDTSHTTLTGIQSSASLVILLQMVF
jgi:hypothetical protein